MIIVMEPKATQEQVEAVKDRLVQAGFQTHLSVGESRTIIGVIGDKKEMSKVELEVLSGVEKCVSITEDYKLVNREFKPEDTIIDVGGAKIGGNHLAVMAGPCAVESIEQLREAAQYVKASGAQFLRGGAFKPRTSPYAFQGLEIKGLEMLAKVGQETGLKIVTEIMDASAIDAVCEYADVLQIGARNMQNFYLLKEVGKTNKPVLLKRGLAATVSEWLNAAEYIMSEGNFNVIFCERGIRTYETVTRNTLDLSAVVAIKAASHLPIIVDPSHGTGVRNMVLPMGRGAIAVGADGLMVEMHPNPSKALCDGKQSLTPTDFENFMAEMRRTAAFMGKTL